MLSQKGAGSTNVQKKNHGQLPVWNFHPLNPDRCWPHSSFSGPDFLLAFTWLLLSLGVRAEADPSIFFPGTQKVHVLTRKQDYYQVALTNLGTVPGRLRSWKDLKNFLGVLNVIYFPAGKLEKMPNKQRVPTTRHQSGSC